MDTTFVRLPSVRSASVELDKSEEAGTAFVKGNRTRDICDIFCIAIRQHYTIDTIRPLERTHNIDESI